MSENEFLADLQAQPEQKRKGCRGCLLWMGIIVGVMALLLCLFAGLTWFGGNKAKAELTAKYLPPSQMVDVGGYRLHINCQGVSEPGFPTVVLEAGASEFSLTWDHVQRQVAEFAHVCAYDRAGLGWSERGPNPRTAPHIADEFDALLMAAGVEPPYVLVGHSMGALYVRFYTHEHPDRVVGMVLVDGGHEELNQRLPQALVKAGEQANLMLRIPQALSAIGLLDRDPSGFPDQFLVPQAPGTEETYKAILAMSPHFFTTAIEETAAEKESYAAMCNLPDRKLGDLPLVVISAGKFAASAVINLSAEDRALVMAVWAELQAELATLSSNGRQVIAEDAGHHIHIDRPELVIDAIREVLEAAQH